MTSRRLFLVILGCLLALIGAENLGTPRNAGPDEPSHIVRGAGLVRGQLLGDQVLDETIDLGGADVDHANAAETDAIRRFDVPRWIAQPSEACFAHHAETPAGCSVIESAPGSGLASTAATYPIWSHILPGLATLVIPNPSALWLARFLHGVIPAVLIAWTLTRLLGSGRHAAAAAVLVALTPMVVFLLAVVNPSGIVVAGAIALWVAGDELFRSGRAETWLFPIAFAALVLPRDDGLLWAALTVGLLTVMWRRNPWTIWRALPRTFRVALGAATAAGGAWAILVGGDLVPVDRPATGVEFAELVVERTGRHIREAVGVLGWLDTQIPESMFALWCFAAGLVFMVALVTRQHRRAVCAASALGLFIVSGWVLEVIQGHSAGLFWQGRYALAMLVGFVLLSGLSPDADRSIGPVGAVVPGVLGLVVLNVSFLQQLRRWGTGQDGSIRPWAWDTWGAPLPIVVLVLIHVAASLALGLVCSGRFAAPAPTAAAPVKLIDR